MSLLKLAGDVDVLEIVEHRREAGEADNAVHALCAYLDSHGVAATPHIITAESLDPGEAILSRAADLGSDLLVMEAYGHSRVRELLPGGATRTLLSEVTLPVFTSH